MTLSFLFSLSGRFSRRRFWLVGVGIPSLIVLVMLGVVFALANFLDPQAESGQTTIALLVAVFQVPALAISIAAVARRMHDLGRSGWWWLLNLVPVVNIGMGIWQGFVKGTEGPNEYGPDPLQPEASGRGAAPSRWVLVGTGGQYANCEFPLDQAITFGTNPRHCSVVIDARRYPDIEPAHCQLQPPAGGRPAALYWPDSRTTFNRRDETFDGVDLRLGSGLDFQVRAVA